MQLSLRSPLKNCDAFRVLISRGRGKIEHVRQPGVVQILEK
jgi:hypothetical protein